MSPKLTFAAFSRALATIGAVSVGACGGAAPPAESPVEAKEVPAATEAAPAGDAPAKAADAPAPGDAPSAGMAPASGDSAAPAAADATPAATEKKDDPQVAPSPGTPAKKTGKKKAAGAKSGCGPGTCG
jgi:starch synthase